MGGIILVASIIIWALSYFPRYSAESVPESYRIKALAEMPAENAAREDADDLVTAEYQQENSILAHIGKGVEPVMRPMDFDWKVCCSLLAGAAAKEVVVSTLGVLYVGDDDAEMLSERLKTPSPVTGIPPFTAASAMAFLVFVLLYFPCMASIAAIVRETGSWRYGLFAVVYNTAVAWLFSWITFRIFLLF